MLQRTTISAAVLLACLAGPACEKTESSPAASTAGTAAPPAPPGPTSSSDAHKATPAAPTPSGNAGPAPLAKPAATDEIKALAKSDEAFALDLYGKARAQKGNLALSPFSVSTALTMAWAGAKGDTAAQMAKVLHLEGATDRTLDVAGSLVTGYGAPDQKVTVRIANRLFGDKSYAFEKPYLARVDKAFGAPLEPLDFKTASEAARKQINTWVARETSDRIKDLVPAGGVNKDTRLVLTNAIYFLGDWDVPFERSSTAPAPFFTGKTDKKDVPTMHGNRHVRFAATDGVKLIEMPYENEALAMDLVLPDAVDGLEAVEARLEPEALDRWIGAAATEEVNVSLPKFEIAPAAPLSLADALSALGMPLAFERGKADFTGIANPPSLDERLFIFAVFHEAYVKVDEKGTEAAAATAAPMASITGVANKEFKADHPFLFFLRDVRSGLVLFMGRVADPSSK